MAKPDETSEIIERIYDVAVDPSRYEAMLDVWEQRLSVLRLKADEEASLPIEADTGIEAHLERADIFLQRLFDLQADAGRSPLDLEAKAAFLVDQALRIDSVNEAARATLGLAPGRALDGLPLHSDDVAKLKAAIRRQLPAKTPEPTLLRFTSASSDRSILFHVALYLPGNGQTPFVLVRTTELGWPTHLSKTMREAFNLTAAEVEVVRALAEGRSLREISEERGRSLATVRTQISAILAKTETHSQTELIRLTLGLMDVVGTIPASRNGSLGASTLLPIPFRSRLTPDGRRSDWIEFGDPGGRPLLFLPLDYGMIRWSRQAEIAAEQRGIRVISVVRPGYGFSAPLPAKVSYREGVGADLRGLLDHLGIEKAAALVLGADLRFAMALARLDPTRLTGIFGCSAALPVVNARQYERMGKWHRFILANARYAPRILPFLVRSGFALARSVGKESFFRSVNASSPADLRTFSDPEIRAAILLGSDICLSSEHSAHDVFARECIDSESDWADLVRACSVPVRLLQGAEDPQTPAQTVRELMPVFPHLDIEIVEDAGQLLFFQHWPRVLDELETMLPK
ncbi:LuxR C-terminal-related transcriptional regulator [Tianweitania populi]|uniref:Helix-turn-helix transcriptional regulator n=1 Tax=Tianweitania populi TaxID=1607949 RepID=A0A8J3DM94_9HYPH|nr:LuxR C-terminal-related transcriptional regulator [Tianweitania populi]GHD05206.1 helix-turn-helix transcriptional regulator [Tianweitania populi]